MKPPKSDLERYLELGSPAESSAMLRAYELLDSPGLQAATAMRKCSAFDAASRLNLSLAAEIQHYVEPASRYLSNALDSPAHRNFIDQVAMIRDEVISSGAFEHAASLRERAFQAVLPTSVALDRLSGIVVGVVQPHEHAFQQAANWRDSLASRMGTLDHAWAYSDLAQSTLGFARIARLSDAVRFDHPYSDPVNELVEDELGEGADIDGDPLARDEASIEAGLNPSLIAFPEEIYGKVIIAAGFELQILSTPVPTAIEGGDCDPTFDPAHNYLLTNVEQRLRQLVVTQLVSLAGPKWIKQRVPEGVRRKWSERREEDRAAGRPVFAEIQYADFMDLADIMGQNHNWQAAFAPIFHQRDDFILSLRRLHPVRKALAHGRPLGRADTLTLVSEAARILRAMGLPVFG